jgi:hypothetical protein
VWIKETYSVDLVTGEESLRSCIPSTADTFLAKFTEGVDPDQAAALDIKYGLAILKALQGNRIPNDPLYDKQEGFDRPPANNKNHDMGVPEAWDIRRNASQIKVAGE